MGAWGVWRASVLAAVSFSLLASGLSVTSSAQAASAEGGAIGWGMTVALGTNGTVADDSVAVPVVAALQTNGDDTYVDISAGDAMGCALAASGQAHCWGDNSFGQVGNGATGAVVTAATPVVAGQNTGGTFASIETGAAHACGLTSAGEAYCWGINAEGRLGNGVGSGVYSTPQAVVDGQNPTGAWKQVNAGWSFTCGIGMDDSAYCWGSGSDGTIGNGNPGDSPSPSRVLGGPYRTVSAGVGHACAVTTRLTIDCWGSNSSGQLGNGTRNNSPTPVAVSLPSGAQAWDVQVGSNYTCARMTDSRLMCWGDNSVGQLGLGFVGYEWPIPMPVGWQKWRYLSTGTLTTCAVDFEPSSRPYCWGYNGTGQIGDGTRINRASPTAVTTAGVIGNRRVSDISTGLRTQAGSSSAGTLALARPTTDTAKLSSALTFAVGTTAPGTSTTSSLVFTNTGNVPMQVGAPFWRITGQHASVFAVTADACSGQIIAVAGTCSISVRGTPPASGPSIAQLVIDPSTSPPGEEEQVVYLSVVGTRTAPTYPTRTWWVAQSSAAPPVLGSGSSCAAPDAVGVDDTAIRSVLAVVSADDTVHVCAGTYAITSTLMIDDSIAFQGDTASTTILDGNNATQIMRLLDYGVNLSTIVDPRVTVQDLTLREGAAGQPGTPSDLPCNLYPVCGGAIYAEDGTSLTLIDSVLSDNRSASVGGAVGSDGTNDGYNGGLIDVRTSTFVGNLAGVDGGAIGVNFNFKGGGQGHPISQSTFVNNSALGRSGGAIAMVFADARVTGSTFLDNSAAWEGDAVYGGVTISGSLLASALAGDLCQGGSSATLSVASDNSCTVPVTSYANLAIVGLGDWGGPTPTVWIGPGSAAVNANTGACPALDQRGATRSASPCDAGSFERRSGSAQALTSTLDYPATVALTETASPLSAPAVAAAAPAPTYELASGGCTVGASSGAVTGGSLGTCAIRWSIAPTLTQDGGQGDDTLSVVKRTQPALTVVAPAQAGVSTSLTLSTTGGAGSGAVTYDVGASTVCSVAGDLLSLGAQAGTCTVTATKAGDATYDAQTSAAVTIAVTAAPPRPPRPVPVPPSAPTVPDGVSPVIPGDRTLAISWAPPQSSGSSSVMRYEVATDPGSEGCVVEAPQSSCLVTGLTNGVAYVVRVRALNAAGWSPWTVVARDATPRGVDPVTPSVLITGSRVGSEAESRVRVVGTSEGLGPGQDLQPWVALGDRRRFAPGLATVSVDASGGFTWSRRTSKTVRVYFATRDGATRSNRVTIR